MLIVHFFVSLYKHCSVKIYFILCKGSHFAKYLLKNNLQKQFNYPQSVANAWANKLMHLLCVFVLPGHDLSLTKGCERMWVK